MKPKTKLQLHIATLIKQIKPITESQKKHAIKVLFNDYGVLSRKTLYCLECGHTWKEKSALPNKVVCPECSKKLKMITTYNGRYRDIQYYGILEVVDKFQVLRMFYCNKYLEKKKIPSYVMVEVMQHWIGVGGKVTTRSMSVNSMASVCDQWIYGSEMEFRMRSFERGSRNNVSRYNLNPYKIHPRAKILPEITRNGFKGQFHGMNVLYLFSFILSNSKAETLLKAGQFKLLNVYEYYGLAFEEFWPSIRICIRNNYVIDNPVLWRDYLFLLKFFEKDLLNPKYVCTKTLQQDHDRLSLKKQEIDKKRRLKERMEQNDREQIAYQEKKGSYFGIVITEGDLEIKPLQTVQEFMEEGIAMNHCVFSNEYYKKADSLVLSARTSEKKLETIELSLSKLTILQCQGRFNKKTEYHDRIMSLVRKNIKKFKLKRAV